jgi:hypothetical protein
MSIDGIDPVGARSVPFTLRVQSPWCPSSGPNSVSQVKRTELEKLEPVRTVQATDPSKGSLVAGENYLDSVTLTNNPLLANGKQNI